MNIKNKFFFSAAAALCGLFFSACTCTADEAAKKELVDFVPDAKNCLDVEFRELPANFETLLKTAPERWHFGFRPYGKSASQLWTDPIVQRDALIGEDTEKSVCAITVYCSEKGFDLLIFTSEPGFKKALEEGKNLPAGTSECFFTPGDADTSKIEHYYQFISNNINPKINCYPWMMEDRTFRSIEDFITAETRFLPNGYLKRYHIPWDPLFDRLPFAKKRDNFWRLSVITNRQTWGGTVHQANQAGYIRWPDFTPAQKTAMRKHVLLRGWNAYRAAVNSIDLNLSRPFERNEAYFKEQFAHLPHSFKMYGEDFGFRRAYLEKAVADRDALGKTILAFETLSEKEQEEFYAKASDMLFNFRYDVEEGYRKYMKSLIFKR